MADGNRGSKEDRAYGLEPGEFAKLEAEHKRKVSKPGNAVSITGVTQEGPKRELGGLAEWDEKTQVRFVHVDDGHLAKDSLYANRQRSNFRIPFLFPVCCLGLAIFAFTHFKHDGFGLASLGTYVAVAIPVLLCSWLMSRRGDGFGVGVLFAAMFGIGAWAWLHLIHIDDPVKNEPKSSSDSSGLPTPHWVPPARKLSSEDQKEVERQREALKKILADEARKSGR